MQRGWQATFATGSSQQTTNRKEGLTYSKYRTRPTEYDDTDCGTGYHLWSSTDGVGYAPKASPKSASRSRSEIVGKNEASRKARQRNSAVQQRGSRALMQSSPSLSSLSLSLSLSVCVYVCGWSCPCYSDKLSKLFDISAYKMKILLC